MITGIPSIDSGLQDVEENLKKSIEKSKQFEENLALKLKNANKKEKEFIIFKLFFNGVTCNEKNVIIDILKRNPIPLNRLFQLIKYANDAKTVSRFASYNRNSGCVEIMEIYKSLLNKMSKLAKELNISNSLELSVLFSYLLWNGYLSKTKKHEYKEYNERPLLMGFHFTDISNGIGVCRNYSEMLKDFLNYSGYQCVILENYLGKVKVNYIMDLKKRKICNTSNEITIKKKKPNHAFNLIEDNGLYIYDPTNLLLYNLLNKNTSTLINGKGKNIIFPYHSYDFCYSKDDERLLDRILTEETFVTPYNNTDFISTSEVNLELLKNSTSLLEDFYKEAKPDIVGISEEIEWIYLKKLKKY